MLSSTEPKSEYNNDSDSTNRTTKFLGLNSARRLKSTSAVFDIAVDGCLICVAALFILFGFYLVRANGVPIHESNFAEKAFVLAKLVC